MAAHVITQIRDRFASALGSMITVPAEKVFVDRIYPLERSDMPCVLLSASSENVASATFGAPGIGVDRSLNIDIVICVSALSGYDNMANQIQMDIEQAMAANFTLGGVVSSVIYRGRSKSLNGEGEAPFVSITMNWEVNYRTDSENPDVFV